MAFLRCARARSDGPRHLSLRHFWRASNPWEVEPEDYAKQEFSGSGTELVLETLDSADWPIVVLRRLLAFNILLAHERYGDSKPLDYWHRVPLGGSITRDSVLRHLLIAPPDGYPAQFSLDSGTGRPTARSGRYREGARLCQGSWFGGVAEASERAWRLSSNGSGSHVYRAMTYNNAARDVRYARA
ncbi:MAG TPA: hypothetical protein VJM12_00120 [Pyrinomonadaceae bacterium]|nr:hypothetical protein [Pyrinomonadaceae bacterium]